MDIKKTLIDMATVRGFLAVEDIEEAFAAEQERIGTVAMGDTEAEALKNAYHEGWVDRRGGFEDVDEAWHLSETFAALSARPAQEPVAVPLPVSELLTAEQALERIAGTPFKAMVLTPGWAKEFAAAHLAAIRAAPASDDWFSQVVSFFIKHDMLDARDEYDISDIIGALQDNYAPQPVLSQPEVKAEIERVVQSVNEWDDRTSPDEYPYHLLITSEELADILRNFASTLTIPDHPKSVGENEIIDFLYKHGDLTYSSAEKAIKLLAGNGYRFTSALCPLSDIPAQVGEVDDDISPYEQPLRDAVEPFLDWLEQREGGAHIKEVREGLIGVEDVLPDSLVVLGAHLRSGKDEGVLTMGHFRKLQNAYDGNATASEGSEQ